MTKIYTHAKVAVLLMFAIFMLQACDFEQYQDDPNKPSQGLPSLLMPTLIEDHCKID